MAKFIIGINRTRIQFVEVTTDNATQAERLVRAWIDLGKPAGVEQVKLSAVPDEARAENISSVELVKEVE